MKTTLPLGEQKLPQPLPLRKLIGPSFILLGLGLGSGEIILWPYLTSNYGLGIAWAIVIGLTMQFFINMEVERYALIYGESIFVGFARMLKILPAWFILSTFLGFGWPGIGLAGATLLSTAFGVENVQILGVIIFLVIGAILTLGKVLYKTVERLQMWLIGIGVPFIIGLALYLSEKSDFIALGSGIIGQGEGFEFLPFGISIAAFLGALAYSGAGGNLNLGQSFYVRDKGYAMGKYADKITGLFRKGGKQKFSITGNTFKVNQANISLFQKWWRVVNLEHLIVFWGLGLITMLTLALLAYVTSFGLQGNAEGINFVINEAMMIASRTLPAFGTLFLLATGIMLCATQLTVLDSTSRIMTENFLLLKGGKEFNVTKIYYIILWIQILFGIAVFSLGFDQPLTLIILGAVINAFAMFVYCGLLLWINNSMLAKPLRPAMWRNLILGATFLFFGGFSYLVIVEKFF
ncbi:Nramp family divalent metal transporter [Patescibacteria group bacterium]|nr:Nramp family divalent metal transporter [Patescibacteria group bacterium]MBU1123130.1 Nramp family divalent metal transporter [Patescibacteria group bacterium]MBU1911048.1 Nramp family divalent metal transporter [Patescibacteria group bacterium]